VNAPPETERTNTADESAADNDQESRLKRYDQRIEEWITSLKEEAEQRSPEVLSALATKAKDVGDYLDKLADKARSRNEHSATSAEETQSFDEVPAGDRQSQGGYRGPDPQSDPKGGGEHEDQGTLPELLSRPRLPSRCAQAAGPGCGSGRY
jgi:hypothetical protein